MQLHGDGFTGGDRQSCSAAAGAACPGGDEVCGEQCHSAQPAAQGDCHVSTGQEATVNECAVKLFRPRKSENVCVCVCVCVHACVCV